MFRAWAEREGGCLNLKRKWHTPRRNAAVVFGNGPD
jgi:hypothetical protein